MIITIQCAATKKPGARSMSRRDGMNVMFVARPELAPSEGTVVFARPDDVSDTPPLTWRQRLEKYNSEGTNPLGLLPSYQLYTHPIYEQLVSTFGAAQIRILSAGWGLVRADYLLPK